MLHALSLSSRMWTEQRGALLQLGHRVLAPDQRTPPETAAPSLNAVADDLACTLDRQGIREAVMVGSSMGGYVAMAFLRRHPGRVRALALLATKAGADDAETAAQRQLFAELVLDPASRSRVVSSAIPKLLGATTRAERPGVVERVREIVEAAAAEAIAWSQRAIAARRDSFDVLRAVNVPSVVVAGEEDELIPVAEARQLAEALPQGELITIPGAGHLTPMEAPDIVTATLTDLLRRAR
jgi:pimeloyl-ACP methyl ester carboxylesterase